MNGKPHARTELRVFYVVVLVLALFGQSSGASSWLIPPGTNEIQRSLYWVLVVAFVAVLELGAVVLLRRAETQRRNGQRAWIAILTAIALALGAAALSWAGHWGPTIHEQIQAWAFAGSTLLGVIVWAIMADLSIDAQVARNRAVREAVRRYIRALQLDGAEKAVLLATVNIPLITRWIMEGPDSVEGTGHERDIRIAGILATAIDPETWHGHELDVTIPKAPLAAKKPAPVPAPVEEPRPAATVKPKAPKPATGSPRVADFGLVQDAFVELYVETGRVPGCRAIEQKIAGEDRAPKKTTIAEWIKANPKEVEKLTVRAESVRAGRVETAAVSA